MTRCFPLCAVAAILAAPIAGQRSSPLVLSVATDKPVYSSGETVNVTVSIKNVSDHIDVVAKSIFDGNPAGYVSTRVQAAGKEITTFGTSSMPTVQVMVGGQVAEDRFLTLKPGESAVLYWQKFSRRYDFHGPPHLKSSYVGANTVDLSSGAYTLRATYYFHRDGAKEWPGLKITGSVKAKQLYNSSFAGNLAASTSFRVGG